jgi:hypothetical protein
MDPILELLKNLNAAITGYVKSGTDKAAERSREVLDVIRKDHTEVLWQPIANVGFAAGRTERDPEISTLTARVTAAESKVPDLERKVTELSAKNTEVAGIQTEAARRIAEAEAKATEAEARSKTAVVDAVKSRDRALYKANLIARGVHPDIAEAQAILLDPKMKYDEKGVLTIMQDGEGNIPYTVHGEELLNVVADSRAKSFPAAFFTSKVDVGGGGGGDGAPGTGGSGEADIFSRIRAEEKTRSQQSAPVDIAGAYRVGGRFNGPQPAGASVK